MDRVQIWLSLGKIVNTVNGKQKLQVCLLHAHVTPQPSHLYFLPYFIQDTLHWNWTLILDITHDVCHCPIWTRFPGYWTRAFGYWINWGVYSLWQCLGRAELWAKAAEASGHDVSFVEHSMIKHSTGHTDDDQSDYSLTWGKHLYQISCQ